MTLDEIKAIIKEFDQSGLTLLEVESKESKIKLEKNRILSADTNDCIQNQLHVSDIQNTAGAMKENIAEGKEISDHTVFIKAPLVGVYYEKSEPNAKPYVTIGQRVKKGEVLCLIEAMKMINEITSPVNGVVKSILVANESLVSFGELLMEIEEQ